jgi:hypothetical protein
MIASISASLTCFYRHDFFSAFEIGKIQLLLFCRLFRFFFRSARKPNFFESVPIVSELRNSQILLQRVIWFEASVFFHEINFSFFFKMWCQNVIDVTLSDNFQYLNQFLRMRLTNWPSIFVDQGQFSVPDFISGTH